LPGTLGGNGQAANLPCFHHGGEEFWYSRHIIFPSKLDSGGGEEEASADNGIRGESHLNLGEEGGYTRQRLDDDGFEDSIVMT